MSAAPPEGSLPPAESPPPPVPDAVPPVVTPPPVFAPPPAVLDAPPPPPTPVAVPPVFAPPPAALDAPPPAPVAVPPVFAPPPAVLDAPPPPVPVAEPPVFAPPPAVLGAPPPPTPVAVPPVFAPPPAILDTPPPAVLNTPPPAVLNTPPPAVLDAPPPAVLGTPPPVPAAEPPALSPPPVAVPPENSSPPPPETPAGSPPPPATLSPPPIAIVPPGPPPPPKVGTSPPPLNAINPSISPSPNAGAASTRLSTGVVAGIAAGGGLLALLVLVALFLFCRKKRNKKDTLPYDGHGGASVTVAASKMSGMNDSIGYSVNGNSKPPLPPGSYNGSIPLPPDGSPSLGNSRVWFTYDELHKATNGFAQEKLLGEGGFGRVYKGELPTGQLVAVKQLTVGGGQGDREFRAEVEIISRVHHRHLVSLVGYCIADKQRLLVYDFVPNGTLDVNLYGKGKPVMTWEMRVRVALGAARGLAYLHEDCHPRIIHRDIKSSNILLDDKYEAQVADFGLAKPASDTHTHVSTRVMGTYGYLAPEYAQSGKLTEKSDVFSFGVMLLELITGRKPVDSRNPDVYVSLVEWARPLMTQVMEDEELDDFVDPRLDGDYDPKEMFRMIEVAASCVRHTANKRPKMGQVVRALESEEENAGLFQDLKPGHSSEHESDFDKFGGSDYDTQEYVADMMRMKKSHQSNRSYGSEYTSEYPSPSIAGSSGEYEPMIRPKTEPFMGRANNGKEHGPISVRSGRPIPENRSRSETYSVPSRPPTRAAPPRPGQLNDSLVSSSDRSGSLRSDTVFVPPPPPPNYNEDYVSIDFNSLGSGKQEGRRKIMEEI